MRVIEVASFGVPRAGSFIPALATLLGSARARGWPAEAVFGADSEGLSWLDEFERREIPVRFAPSSSPLRLRGWFEELLDETLEPTVIHSHFSQLDVPVLLAGRRRPHTAVIWHVHTVLSHHPLRVLRNVVRFGMVGRGVDLILTPSPDLAASIRRRGAPAGRVRTFLNAIDPMLYPFQDRNQWVEARRSLGIAETELVLLHFGLVDWRLKGGDLYLRSVRKLVDDGLPITALTLTEAPEARRLCRELGLDHRVRLLAPRDDVQELFAAADVMVTASRADATAYAVMESLASGTPVVASDIPGHRLIAQGLAACRLVPHEPALIAAGVRDLLERDAATADRDARSARAWIESEFDLRDWCERLLDTYEEVAATAICWKPPP